MSISAQERPTQLAFLDSDSSEIALLPNRVEDDTDNFSESCIGASVDLGRRALWLMRALDEYSKASRLKSLPERWQYDTRLHRQYSEKDVREMTATIPSKESEGSSFFRMSGNMHLLNETDATSEMVNEEIRQGNEEFVAKYIGPTNEAARKAYRKVLKRHILMAKNKSA